jgi:hypothetical protein
MSAHRAAIYCRVSTDLQLSGTSLTSQRDQCVDFASRDMAGDCPIPCVTGREHG